jgi:hypothetical protein
MGCADGSAVGCVVGSAVGKLVGFVGIDEGCVVGALDGWDDG